MSFHAIASLLITISSMLLGLFVYLVGRNKASNITLALYSVSVAAWSFGQFMTETVADYNSALFWARFHLAGAIFIPVFFVHFVSAFLNRKNNTVIILSYILGIVIFMVSFSPLFVPSVSEKLGFRFYPNPGPAFIVYSAMFLLLVLHGIYQLVKAYYLSTGIFKNQIIWVLLAAIIGFAGGSMMFLPVYNIKVFPIGYYLVPVYIVIAIYAFMKHRLLDISFVIRKGLVYSILTATITIIYISSIILFNEVFKVVTGSSSMIITPAIILLMVIFLNPIKDKVQKYVDIIFFKSRYDYQKALRRLSFEIRDITKLEDIVTKAVDDIQNTIKAASVSLYIYDKKIGKYVLQRGNGPDKLGMNSPLAVSLCNKKSALLQYDLPKDIRECGISICFPMIIKNKLVGILMFGEKLSGDMFSDEDIDLLTTISNQIAVSIENSMLYEEMLEAQKHLYQADKLSTLGTLAASLAHEIKNPIASIKGFAQLIPKALKEHDDEAISDFTTVVPKQLDRINELMEKLLKLSRPVKPESKDVHINLLLDEIIKLIERQCFKQGVTIEKEYQVNLVVKGDPNQLMQAYMNIMINALQSMEHGGKMTIKSQKEEDKSVVVITDTGKGITADVLDHIFDPFYTTKEGGSGLGLVVTQKIISDHHGNIEVVSEVGLGTSFIISLPL